MRSPSNKSSQAAAADANANASVSAKPSNLTVQFIQRAGQLPGSLQESKLKILALISI